MTEITIATENDYPEIYRIFLSKNKIAREPYTKKLDYENFVKKISGQRVKAFLYNKDNDLISFLITVTTPLFPMWAIRLFIAKKTSFKFNTLENGQHLLVDYAINYYESLGLFVWGYVQPLSHVKPVYAIKQHATLMKTYRGFRAMTFKANEPINYQLVKDISGKEKFEYDTDFKIHTKNNLETQFT